MAQLWWEEWPERLEFELQELRDCNIDFVIDEEERARGKMVLNINHSFRGEDIRLIARYPVSYPYFRFEIKAPDLNLARHQHPYEKNLCLIGRSLENWNSSEDTVARFIIDQLPKAIESAEGGDDGLEESQGEPVSEYYPYQGCMLLIDSSWEIDSETKEGILLIGQEENGNPLRMAVIEVQDTKGTMLAEAHKDIKKLYPHHFTARWVRLEEPIKAGKAEDFYTALKEQYSAVQNFAWRRNEGLDLNYDVIGTIFPEEVGYKKIGTGWAFLFVTNNKSVNNWTKKNQWTKRYMFGRAGRSGVQDMQERTPKLSFLASKKIAVAGLGSIGAPSAIEFGKSGVGELRILDDDYIEPGTTVRWPLGHQYIGIHKTDAIGSVVSHNYPFTKVISYRTRLGSPTDPKSEAIDNFLEGIDLIYDATAELGVHHYLSSIAEAKGIPYVLVSATAGAWGGMVARFSPGTPCWKCFQRAMTEGKIPVPPEDPDGSFQPTGCANPTFTGTHADLQEVFLAGVRLAISSLAEKQEHEWNAAYVSFKENDLPGLPKWSVLNFESYPDCLCGIKK